MFIHNLTRLQSEVVLYSKIVAIQSSITKIQIIHPQYALKLSLQEEVKSHLNQIDVLKAQWSIPNVI